MSFDEREELKLEFLERGQLVRSRLSGPFPIDHGAEIYGDDGLLGRSESL